MSDQAMGHKIYRRSSAVVSDNVVICGGWDSSTQRPSAKCDILGPNSREWKADPDFPIALTAGSLVSSSENFLFWSGGYQVCHNCQRFVNKTWFLRDFERGWEAGPQMGEKHSDHCSVDTDNTLMVIGGKRGGGLTNGVESWRVDKDFDFESIPKPYLEIPIRPTIIRNTD